jgi:hypothetical protein
LFPVEGLDEDVAAAEQADVVADRHRLDLEDGSRKDPVAHIYNPTLSTQWSAVWLFSLFFFFFFYVHKGHSSGEHECRLSVSVLVRRERLAHHHLEPVPVPTVK